MDDVHRTARTTRMALHPPTPKNSPLRPSQDRHGTEHPGIMPHLESLTRTLLTAMQSNYLWPQKVRISSLSGAPLDLHHAGLMLAPSGRG